MRREIWSIVPFSLTLFACTVGPQYNPPLVEMPCQWPGAHFEEVQLDETDCLLWWQAFNDPLLDSLLERTASQNLDLSIAATRIQEARVEKKAGKNCHDLKALRAKRESVEYEYKNIWVTLSAEVAKNYIELRGLQQRLEIIKKHIAAQEDTLQMISGLIHTGFSSTLDQKQIEEQLNKLMAQKPLVELSISKTIHRLSILLGLNPEELFAELCQSTPIPQLPSLKRIGVPSELLRRRPDILRAERNLAAATEEVGSAVAARFPRISLQGYVGDIAPLGSESFAGYGGCQIFKQDVTFNQLKAQQALYAYQKTVKEALEEAENAIASFHFEWERNRYLAKAYEASLGAHTLMGQLYEKGLKDYVQVQNTNLSLLDSENSYLQSQVNLLLYYIAVYKAIGGDWE